jgi:hypothetical protein
MMTYESIYAGYDAHGRNVWVEHLPRGTWSMQKFTLARPAAKSEIDKAVADATLRANRRAARIVKNFNFDAGCTEKCANEIMGKRRKK